jgi:predicted Zn finger-like uncharacterized protein
MILTCPECATSYFVDDSRIPAGGRSVKCTSCGARWRVTPEPAAEADPEPEPPPAPEIADAAEPEPVVEVQEAEDVPSPPPVDDLVITGPDRRTFAPARRAPPKAAARSGRFKAALFVGVAAVIALLIAAAILLRGEIVRLWPASSAAFAGVGLAVNDTGLVIENLKFEPTFQGGRPVLSVTGAVRNVTQATVEAPPIRFSLLDQAGEPVAAKIARPIEAGVPPGATRYFAVALQDPPSTAVSIDVAFDAGARAATTSAAAAVSTEGPAQIEAQALPADAPGALPEHG